MKKIVKQKYEIETYLSLHKFLHGSIWYAYVELGAGNPRPIPRDFACFLNQLDLIEERQWSELDAWLDLGIGAK